MPKFNVHYQYLMVGYFEVKAATLEEAINKVEENGEFVVEVHRDDQLDDSFEVNRQVTEEMNEEDGAICSPERHGR